MSKEIIIENNFITIKNGVKLYKNDFSKISKIYVIKEKAELANIIRVIFLCIFIFITVINLEWYYLLTCLLIFIYFLFFYKEKIIYRLCIIEKEGKAHYFKMNKSLKIDIEKIITAFKKYKFYADSK